MMADIRELARHCVRLRLAPKRPSHCAICHLRLVPLVRERAS